MKKILVTIVLISSLFVNAQVEVRVDTTHIRIGEQISYSISTQEQPHVQFPKLQLDSLGKVEVVYSLPVDTLKNRLYKKYILTSFDSGHYYIPGQEVLIKNKRFYTDSLMLEVGAIAVDTTKQKLFPIKSIYNAPKKTWRDYTQYSWSLLSIIALLLLIWWIVLRLLKSKKKKLERQLSPIETAINQFQSLDEKELISKEKIKEYYVELTEIVRDYIGKDVKIPTMEVTTDELITLLKIHNKSNKIGIDKDRIRELHQFLREADLVKFAKLKPEKPQIQEDRKTAEKIINEIQSLVHKPVLDKLGNEIVLETPEEIAQKAKKKQRTILALVSGAVLLLAFAITSWYYGVQYVKDTILGHPTKELLEGEWYHSSYGHPSISVETPKVLKSLEIELPPQTQQMITSMANFEYGSLIGGFYIALNSYEYNPDMEFKIDNILDRIDQIVGNQPGVSDFNYEIEDTQVAGNDSKLIQGSLKINAVKLIYTQYMIGGENTLQQIVIARKPNDPYAKEIQERIVKSIQLQTITEDNDE